MKKKLLAVLMTGIMAASFAGTATVVSADSGDDNTLTVWAWDQNFNIKSMQMAGEQYAKDHEGFAVDVIETSSDDCQTKLTTRIPGTVRRPSRKSSLLQLPKQHRSCISGLHSV